MKLTKIFGIVLSLHVAVILLVMFQPGCQTGKGGEETPESSTAAEPSAGFNSGLNEGSGATPEAPVVTGDGKRSPPTPPRPGELLVPTEPGAESPVAGGLRPKGVDIYKVQKGDSLWSIAQKHNLTVDRLLSVNDIAKNATLGIGQEIFVPVPDGSSGSSSVITPDQPSTLITPDEPASAPPPTGVEVHLVQGGDTLSGIARTYGVSVNAIRDANNLRGDIIQIGQRILVPGGVASPAPPVTAPPTPVVSGQLTHPVQAGDTLSTIARRYGISLELLMDMNNIENPNALKIGQTLIIEPTSIPKATPPSPGQPSDSESIESIFRNAEEAPVVPLPPQNE